MNESSLLESQNPKEDTLRSSFKVLLCLEQDSVCSALNRWLKAWKYDVEIVSESLKIYDHMKVQSPHILLVNYNPREMRWLESLKKISPETHFVAFSSEKDHLEALKSKIFYDVLLWPLFHPVLLFKVIDHIIERDHYYYSQERLSKDWTHHKSLISQQSKEILEQNLQIQQLKTALSAEKERLQKNLFLDLQQQKFWSIYHKELSASRSIEDSIFTYMRALSFLTESSEVLFFKYIPSRKSLLFIKSLSEESSLQTESSELKDVCPEHSKYKGMGVELRDLKNIEKEIHNLSDIRIFQEFMIRVVGVDRYFIQPLIVRNHILGVYVVLNNGEPPQESWTFYRNYLEGFLQYNLYQKQFHDLNRWDVETQVWNREHFLHGISLEVSRARRVSLPVSLLVLRLNEYITFKNTEGSQEAQYLIQMVTHVLQENLRPNDIMGRLTEAELGVLLPHTDEAGAKIVAIRLQKIMASANFSRVLSSNPKVSLSVGVSSFPELSESADELLLTADQALFNV